MYLYVNNILGNPILYYNLSYINYNIVNIIACHNRTLCTEYNYFIYIYIYIYIYISTCIYVYVYIYTNTLLLICMHCCCYLYFLLLFINHYLVLEDFAEENC